MFLSTRLIIWTNYFEICRLDTLGQAALARQSDQTYILLLFVPNSWRRLPDYVVRAFMSKR